MLKAIFYARFHEEKGPTVLHQVPEGSVIPLAGSPPPLFHFPNISSQIIPRREFCDRPLSLLSSHHRIIGFPVCIHDPTRYSRSDFIFNFCVVVAEDTPWEAYQNVVGKIARLMRNLEEQAGWLGREERRVGWVRAGQRGYGGGNRVFAVCEMVLEDLNCYCECMIPIDDSNTLNLKLFPTRPPPPPIQTFHVPLSTVRFSSFTTSSWDLTLQRILPFINGINSVQKIALLADTDLTLTKRALVHLLYYGCILMLDIFHFSAVYAPTAEITVFIQDTKMQDECIAYIVTPNSPFTNNPSSRSTAVTPTSKLNPASTSNPPLAQPPSRATILHLYASLRQGLSLRDWCLAHAPKLSHIDIRRFVTFGLIKGFLYRSHRFAIALRAKDTSAQTGGVVVDPIAQRRADEKAWRKAAMSSGWRTPGSAAEKEKEREKQVALMLVEGDDRFAAGGGGGGGGGGSWGGNGDGGLPALTELQEGKSLADQYLARYLDGLHCLDEVCSDTGLGFKDAVNKLRGLGDVVFVNR